MQAFHVPNLKRRGSSFLAYYKNLIGGDMIPEQTFELSPVIEHLLFLNFNLAAKKANVDEFKVGICNICVKHSIGPYTGICQPQPT